MRKDEWLFLEIFGDIKEEYIEQALQPWKGRRRSFVPSAVGRKVACLLLLIAVFLSCVFHRQVEAAIRRFTTVIQQILHLNDDLTSYVDFVNMTLTKEGISVTIEEVILSKHDVLVSVTTDGVDDDMGFGCGDIFKINGVEKEAVYSGLSQGETLEDSKKQWILNWFFCQELDVTEMMEIELSVNVYREMDEDEIPFFFLFSAAGEELEKDTRSLTLHQEAKVSSDIKLDFKVFTLNKVTSNIWVECEGISIFDAQYFLKGRDSLGNLVSYQVKGVDGSDFIFGMDEGLPSMESEWLDLQLYEWSYYDGYEAYEEVYDENDEEEYIESTGYSGDDSAMKPIGEIFRIEL